MSSITYVTGNYGKYVLIKEQFEESGLDIEFLKHNFDEPEINDIEYISKQKAIEAYNILKSPCFVADAGFYINSYPNNPGYPGAFTKRSGISSDIDNLLDVMKNVEDRTCQFVDCLTFYDGEEFYTFYGVSKGRISDLRRGNPIKKAKSNLWYVFIPNNHSKTLAEMTDEERKNRHDGHTSATKEFINWYKNIYKKDNCMIKRNN